MVLRVYTDGVWDVLHPGHVALFKTIKTDMFPNDVFLIVGCAGDETCTRKGETVMTTTERVAMVTQCRYVDMVVSDCPWSIDADFMAQHAIDFVVHDGAPYPSEDTPDIYAYVKEKGQFISSTRTPGISTSYIITRILADYNRFLLRNLKRGTSHEELNISDLKARYLLLKDSMTQKNKLFRAAALELLDNIPPPPSRWVQQAYVLAASMLIIVTGVSKYYFLTK
jgi:choline-phosphate cytidylyltransferase